MILAVHRSKHSGDLSPARLLYFESAWSAGVAAGLLVLQLVCSLLLPFGVILTGENMVRPMGFQCREWHAGEVAKMCDSPSPNSRVTKIARERMQLPKLSHMDPFGSASDRA